jgi:plastocyanin
MIRLSMILAALLTMVAPAAYSFPQSQPAGRAATAKSAPATAQQASQWPDPTASKEVSLARTGPAKMTIVIQTHAVAVKETGPKATVAKFGEVYDWSPAFIAVHQNEPTRIFFWNLQPDDMHDFTLFSLESHRVLMNLQLPPLTNKSYILTFHKQGLYTFVCSVHTPEMMGQILVLPPAPR